MAKHLLRSQKNELFALIQYAGLDPANFEWRETVVRHSSTGEIESIRKTPIPDLVFVPQSSFHFAFQPPEIDPPGPSCFFSPGFSTVHEEAAPATWGGATEVFKHWLTYLRREVDVPDLWEELRRMPKLGITPSDEAPDEPLSPGERAAIKEAIDEVRGLLADRTEVEASEREAMRAVLGRIADATEKAANKSDLRLLVLGTVVQTVIAGVMTAENGRWLLTHLQVAFAKLPLLMHKIAALTPG